MKPHRLALPALVALVAISALAVSAQVAAPAPGWNHDPGSSIGPQNWGNLDPAFETCLTGKSQSPVNITGTVPGGQPALQFRLPDNPLVVENTRHVIEVPIPDGNGNT